MKLTFYGACRTVTGSCSLLETSNTKILIDCGMHQGSKDLKERNYGDFLFSTNDIDYLILTHAHIDHSGLIPKLVKSGFKGKILATKPTTDLCSIMLPDSGHIQELEVERKNRKLARAGEKLLTPIYDSIDAKLSMMKFSTLDYDLHVNLTENISVRFKDAGHILGSAIVEIWVKENSSETKLVFSGDLGNTDQPIIKDPSYINEADYVIMETTYGNRFHKDLGNKKEIILEIIKDTFNRGGNVIIPAFAVERTQDVLYYLAKLDLEGRLPDCKVYVDSPLAISASEIFKVSIKYYDEETKKALEKVLESPLILEKLTMTRSAAESMKLNDIKSGAIIISASGMCEAGRIKHHLKHNLWRPESSVVFVGYQAPGTLGRLIVDGQQRVRIHGEEVAVKAQIHNIEGFSSHADQPALLKWVKAFKKPPKKVFLVHGEEEGMKIFKDILQNELDINVIMPEWQQSFELTPIEVKSFEPKTSLERNVDLLYISVLHKLSELYKLNKQRQDLHLLYEKLKEIEEAIQ